LHTGQAEQGRHKAHGQGNTEVPQPRLGWPALIPHGDPPPNRRSLKAGECQITTRDITTDAIPFFPSFLDT
jgi:hypothetical protein